MNVTFEQISRQFSKQALHIQWNKAITTAYSDTMLITKSLTHFAPEFIYVGYRSGLPDHAEGLEQASLMLINDTVEPASGQHPQMYSRQNRMEFGAEEDVFELYNRTRGLFLEELEREQAKGRMLEACVMRQRTGCNRLCCGGADGQSGNYHRCKLQGSGFFGL